MVWICSLLNEHDILLHLAGFAFYQNTRDFRPDYTTMIVVFFFFQYSFQNFGKFTSSFSFRHLHLIACCHLILTIYFNPSVTIYHWSFSTYALSFFSLVSCPFCRLSKIPSGYLRWLCHHKSFICDLVTLLSSPLIAVTVRLWAHLTAVGVVCLKKNTQAPPLAATQPIICQHSKYGQVLTL